MSFPTAKNSTTRRVVPAQEARQGEATGHVRYVLGTSLALAAAAGIVLYIIHVM